MKRLIHTLAAASLVLLFGISANAQPSRDRDRDERYHRFGRATLDRVRGDLARAERNLRYVGDADMRRFHNIQEGLAGFQRKWERGRYDRDDLDQAIGNLHALVDRGRLRPRDRDLLADDLRRLRELHDRIERPPPG
jgi:hypothetical protein